MPDDVAHFPGAAPPFLGHGARREPPPGLPDKTRTVVPGARHWPLAALLLASVLWSGAITGTKYALRAFDPVTLLSLELAAAAAALWAVLLIRGYRPPPSWPAAVLLGLLEPALVVILAGLVLGEAISRAGIVAVVACLAGLVVLTGGGGRSTAVGDLCIVAACSAPASTASW